MRVCWQTVKFVDENYTRDFVSADLSVDRESLTLNTAVRAYHKNLKISKKLMDRQVIWRQKIPSRISEIQKSSDLLRTAWFATHYIGIFSKLIALLTLSIITKTTTHDTTLQDERRSEKRIIWQSKIEMWYDGLNGTLNKTLIVKTRRTNFIKNLESSVGSYSLIFS